MEQLFGFRQWSVEFWSLGPANLHEKEIHIGLRTQLPDSGFLSTLLAAASNNQRLGELGMSLSILLPHSPVLGSGQVRRSSLDATCICRVKVGMLQ